MSHGREVVGKWNLTGASEDSYASQTAQLPGTSRRLLSFIPEADGALHREAAEPFYINQVLSGPVVSLCNFNQSNESGEVQRFYFAAARTTFTVDAGDFLGPCNLYIQQDSIWIQVTDVGTLSTAPVFRVLNNLLYLVDGEINWTFDGTNWFKTGITLPYQGGFTRTKIFSGPPFWQPAIDNTGAGVFDAVVGRYYWFTNADQTASRPVHEGSSSAISDSTGAVTNKKIKIYQTPGLWSVTSGSKEITVAASTDAPGPTKPLDSVSPDPGNGPAALAGAFNGLTLYINGTLIGVIAGVDLNGGGDNVLVLAANSPSTISGGRAVICDARCTHWNLYASESDGSKVGQFLNVSTPVTQNLGTTPVQDASPFLDDPTNTFASTFRPVRNDPPPASLILETHKARLFRTNFSKPNLFNFTANEEVDAGNNGNPSECVPGQEEFYSAESVAQNTSEAELAGAGSTDTISPYTSWSNPSNVTSAVSYATVALTFPNASTGLYAKSFPFAIPSDATILGIQVDFECFSNASIGSGHVVSIVLRKAGSLANYGFEAIEPPNSVDSFTVGGPTSLWFGTWTPADINGATFGPVFAANLSNDPGTKTTSLRNVSVTVYYQEALSGGPQSVFNTISDLVNSSSFPDQSNKIRAMISHADALYIGSERQVFPLYGESYDDFAISQVTAFSVGLAGRFCGESTMHGLPFISYDKKALLYPSNSAPSANATAALIEIGLPIRNRLSKISAGVQLDEVVTKHYFYDKRDWWLVGFRNSETSLYETWVYDFNIRGWFQLQRGFSSLAVFEIDTGNLILVGGADDGKVYVIDDISGTFTSSADLPAATWRPALIDFGDPDSDHIAQYIDLEFSNSLMPDDITVTYWLDPGDANDPGTGTTLVLQRVLGANRYRAWFNKEAGVLCHRLLIEVAAAASQNAGAIRGAKLVGQKAKGIIGNPGGLTSGN